MWGHKDQPGDLEVGALRQSNREDAAAEKPRGQRCLALLHRMTSELKSKIPSGRNNCLDTLQAYYSPIS
ncbi:hypothetical protein I79_009114 [Cricetulus griseus]|uniref:Uncharacterized protein n=1 Tax=Cricetulus griseus TaxID=10029 RepID=G3HEW8_CRIGR|nr:hypothetical protein I79_009114 [Cricetulus griseus]